MRLNESRRRKRKLNVLQRGWWQGIKRRMKMVKRTVIMAQKKVQVNGDRGEAVLRGRKRRSDRASNAVRPLHLEASKAVIMVVV